MGGGAVVVAGTSNAYPGKLTWSVFKACIVASMGGLIFGYDIGISGNSPFVLLLFIFQFMLQIFITNIWGLNFGSGGVTSMDSFLVRFFPSIYCQKNLILNELIPGISKKILASTSEERLTIIIDF